MGNASTIVLSHHAQAGGTAVHGVELNKKKGKPLIIKLDALGGRLL